MPPHVASISSTTFKHISTKSGIQLTIGDADFASPTRFYIDDDLNRKYLVSSIDEYSRECLAIDVERRLTSEDVLERLSALFIRRGVPDYIRSDNGTEFLAKMVRRWLQRADVQTLFIAKGTEGCRQHNGHYSCRSPQLSKLG